MKTTRRTVACSSRRGVTIHLVFLTDDSNGDGLFRVNDAQKHLKGLLHSFNGVSIKCLVFYCKWSNFLEFVRRAGRDLEAAMQDLVARDRYDILRNSAILGSLGGKDNAC